jgi:DNA modification methylase
MSRTPRHQVRASIPAAPQRRQLLYRRLDELKFNPRNARRHSDKQISQIAASIRAFGFVSPIITDGKDHVVIGEGRLKAATRLGLAEVPTLAVDDLSPVQLQALMIADNKLALNSEWDERLLGENLKELTAAGLDFSIEAIGFEVAEIDLSIQKIESQVAASDDVLVETGTGDAVTTLGEVWLLGEHRLMVGDARDPQCYVKLMAGLVASAAITDPPYNVPIDGFVTGKGRNRHREFAVASGEMSEREFRQFLTKSMKMLVQHTSNGSLHYVFMDWRHAADVLEAGNGLYTELKNICVWAKHNAGMGSLYRSQHELVFVFKKGSATHQNNIALGKYGRHRSNVWNYPGANSPGHRGEKPLDMHPTVKPVALVSDAILDCTTRGEIVLDPFLGSGTTLIAAERTGRRCYGMEIDPLYADTIIRRWELLTGRVARRGPDKKSFQQLAQKRGLP